MDKISKLKRTHNCGELSNDSVGKRVTLMGWVDRRRDHGGVIFIDLRDREGVTQIVFNPQEKPDAHKKAEEIRNEYVLAVSGIVGPRPDDMINTKLKTGKIEILIDEIQILNTSKTPPVQVNEDSMENEELRLKYRYLDLRRPWNQKKIITRHKISQTIRTFLSDSDFIEIETPILMKSTPEGARDFLVPSRLNQGNFYALPQSPQTYKQILMVAGFEKYFQITRCFRDEDLRADRQPEFTQVDCEMSFVEIDDIIETFDGMLKHVFKKSLNKDITTPIDRMSYKEAMVSYASDKPDLRFGLKMHEIQDIISEFTGSGIPFFEKDVENGGIVKIMKLDAKFAKELSRSALDKLESQVKNLGGTGLGYARIEENLQWKSPLAKFIKDDKLREKINQKVNANSGDLIFFQSGKEKLINTIMNDLRLTLGKRFSLIKKDDFRFVWITDFPMFEYSEEDNRWSSMHHPFTSPVEEDIPLLDTDEFYKTRSKAYDIVLNGNEIGGGSIRIHNSELQKKVFKALKISDEEAESKFSFLLDALKYGAPPHGGIAFGLDRLIMIMLGEESIREVIAFPKTSAGTSLMDGAPGNVSAEQLKELGIKTIV